MSVIVQKYGGSSLKTPNDILRVAQQIKLKQSTGVKLIIVVSAMGKATDELIQMAYQVSSKPNRREFDMLLTAGERVSMSLMSMALNSIGCPSISFTGSQAGVFTDSSHSNARIIDLKPNRVEENLNQNKIVVLAGFQGVDPRLKEVTTLGRGGSDTTAVALASYFKAESCEILKDVEGIYSADPKYVSTPIRYHQISINALEQSCFWGAKVLHYRSVELAKNLKVPLYIGSSFHPNSVGTSVTEENQKMYEVDHVLTLSVLENIFHIKLKCNSPQECLDKLKSILDNEKLPWPQFLASVFENNEWRALLSSNSEGLNALKNALTPFGFEFFGENLTGITLTCGGFYTSELICKITKILSEKGVHPQKSIATTSSYTIFIDTKQTQLVCNQLHSLVNTNSFR